MEQDLPNKWQIFDLNELEGPVKTFYTSIFQFGDTMLDAWKQYTSAGKNTKVLCLLRKDFYAFSLAQDKYDIIGLSLATPCLIHFCINILLQQNAMFPDLGVLIPDDRYQGLKRFPTEINIQTTIQEGIALIPAISRPLDDKRAEIASTLTEIASIFLLAHEAGHAISGHTKYNRLKFGEAYTDEFFQLNSLFKDRIPYKLVAEYEADMIAAQMIIKFLSADEDMKSRITDVFDLNKSNNCAEYEILGIMITAIFVLFLLLSQDRLDIHDSKDLEHPHPFVRINYIQWAILAIAQRDFNFEIQELLKLFDKNIMMVCQTWQEIGFPLADLIAEGNMMHVEIEKEIRKLEKLQSVYRGKFLKYGWSEQDFWKKYAYPDL